MKKSTVGMFFCFCLILISSVSPSTSAQSVDDLFFMTENYPPYNYKKNGKLQGISVDLLVLILRKMNSSQSIDDIQLTPWARGYYELLNRKNTCLFVTTRTERREKLFKWVGPVSSTTISIIARKDRDIRIKSIDDIIKYKIGVVREDIGEQLLVKAGISLKRLDRIGGINVTIQSIQKLNKGRIDAWSYEENVAKWEIKANGFNPNDYEIVYKLKEGKLYYAFHKEISNSLIQKLQDALDQLKRDGSYQKVLDKYLK